MNSINATCFNRGKLIILEDKNRVISRLENTIKKTKNITYDIARDYNQYKAMLKKRKYDASSLDLDFKGYKLTELIINTLKNISPQTTRIVFSAYDDEFNVANKAGADACFQKGSISYDEYIIKLKEGVSKGIDREIYSYLRKLRVHDLPASQSGTKTSIQTDKRLKDKATQACFQSRAERNINFGLEDLLTRKGWCANFDFKNYFKKNKSQKLLLLAEYVDLNIDEICSLMNIKDDIKIINFELDFKEHCNHVNGSRLNALFGILAHVLKISSYEIFLMPLYMRIKGLYKDCDNPPPWDKISLHNYLLNDLESGLFNAYRWLRSI